MGETKMKNLTTIKVFKTTRDELAAIRDDKKLRSLDAAITWLIKENQPPEGIVDGINGV